MEGYLRWVRKLGGFGVGGSLQVTGAAKRQVPCKQTAKQAKQAGAGSRWARWAMVGKEQASMCGQQAEALT